MDPHFPVHTLLNKFCVEFEKVTFRVLWEYQTVFNQLDMYRLKSDHSIYKIVQDFVFQSGMKTQGGNNWNELC